MSQSPWIVSFKLVYDEKGDAMPVWEQNRQPNVGEMSIFMSQMQVRSFRLASVMAQIEDGLIPQEPAAETTPPTKERELSAVN